MEYNYFPVLKVNISYPQHVPAFVDTVKTYCRRETYMDLKLICKNNIIITTNKMVLASASSFIEQIIRSNYDETIYITLPDVDPNVMNMIIKILCEGGAHLNREQLISLKEVLAFLQIKLNNAVVTSSPDDFGNEGASTTKELVESIVGPSTTPPNQETSPTEQTYKETQRRPAVWKKRYFYGSQDIPGKKKKKTDTVDKPIVLDDDDDDDNEPGKAVKEAESNKNQQQNDSDGDSFEEFVGFSTEQLKPVVEDRDVLKSCAIDLTNEKDERDLVTPEKPSGQGDKKSPHPVTLTPKSGEGKNLEQNSTKEKKKLKKHKRHSFSPKKNSSALGSSSDSGEKSNIFQQTIKDFDNLVISSGKSSPEFVEGVNDTSDGGLKISSAFSLNAEERLSPRNEKNSDKPVGTSSKNKSSNPGPKPGPSRVIESSLDSPNLFSQPSPTTEEVMDATPIKIILPPNIHLNMKSLSASENSPIPEKLNKIPYVRLDAVPADMYTEKRIPKPSLQGKSDMEKIIATLNENNERFLELAYKRNQNPSNDILKRLAENQKIPIETVQKWFKNRQAKESKNCMENYTQTLRNFVQNQKAPVKQGIRKQGVNFDDAVVKKTDGAVVKKTDGAIVKKTDGAIVKKTDGAIVKKTDGAIVKKTDGAIVKKTDGAIVKKVVKQEMVNEPATKEPSNNAVVKRIGKARMNLRKRRGVDEFGLSEAELQVLLTSYSINKHPNREHIINIAKQIGKKYGFVERWFINRRSGVHLMNLENFTLKGTRHEENVKLSERQILLLEKLYRSNKFLSVDDQKALADELNVKREDIAQWFVRRRARAREVTEESLKRKSKSGEKGKSFVFDKEQILILQDAYRKKKVPARAEQIELAEEMNVPKEAVLQWFRSQKSSTEGISVRSTENLTVKKTQHEDKTALNEKQISALEKLYRSNKFLSVDDQKTVADELGAKREAVAQWFIKRRVMSREGASEEKTSPSRNSENPSAKRMPIANNREESVIIDLDDEVEKDPLAISHIGEQHQDGESHQEDAPDGEESVLPDEHEDDDGGSSTDKNLEERQIRVPAGKGYNGESDPLAFDDDIQLRSDSHHSTLSPETVIPMDADVAEILGPVTLVDNGHENSTTEMYFDVSSVDVMSTLKAPQIGLGTYDDMPTLHPENCSAVTDLYTGAEMPTLQADNGTSFSVDANDVSTLNDTMPQSDNSSLMSSPSDAEGEQIKK